LGDLAVGTSTSNVIPILYVNTGENYGGIGIATTSVSGSLLNVGTTTKAFFVNNDGSVGFNNVAYYWPGSQGGSNTVLRNDGSGNLTWVAGSSVGDGASNWTFVSANAIRPSSTAVGIIVTASSTFGATTTINSDLVVTGAMKNVATKIVAASDTPNRNARADYVCDGTNDQVEIQNAIWSLPAQGGIIYLLEGTYYIGSTTDENYIGINVTSSNITIIGAGKSTVLRRAWDAVSTRGVITLGDGGTNFATGTVVTNLSIDGQKQTMLGVKMSASILKIKSLNQELRIIGFMTMMERVFI